MLSKYVIKIPVDDKETLLYNSITNSLISFPTSKEDVEIFIKKLNQEELQYLRKELYLQFREIDEEKLVKMVMNKIKYSSRSVSFIIHLNYNCNLRCVYCYQREIKSKKVMTEETEKDVIKFIKEIVKKTSPEQIELCFIGGEPLLHKRKIKNIINGISNEGKSLKIIKSIITNGTLLNKKTVNELINMKIDLLQVTLDGPQKIHDQLRIGMDNSGSYNKIINNLEAISEFNESINIVINCNINLLNINHIEELFIELRKKRINYPVFFSIVFESRKNSFKYAYKNDINKAWLNAHKIGLKYGNNYVPFYRNSYFTCSFFRDNVFIISPDGYLYKCISGIGNTQYLISHISEYGSHYYYSRVSQFIEKENMNSECTDCDYKIICGGWCVYKKNVYGNICPKQELDENDIPLIVENYKNNAKGNK